MAETRTMQIFEEHRQGTANFSELSAFFVQHQQGEYHCCFSDIKEYSKYVESICLAWEDPKNIKEQCPLEKWTPDLSRFVPEME